jgi:pimeloyl-ACP methyl ester carboxylesterase
VTPRSWEHWIERYRGRRYRLIAPAYPGLEVEVEALNEDPSPIEALTVPAVVEHYEGIIAELERAPIIMGHSMGGLLVYILLDHGYGAAGVAIDSGAPEGVRLVPPAQIRAAFPVLRNPAKRHKAVGFTPSSSTLRLRQHLEPGGLREDLRALPRPRARQLHLGSGVGQLRAGPPGGLGGGRRLRP